MGFTLFVKEFDMGSACFGGAFPVYFFGIFSLMIESDLCKVKTFSFFGGEIESTVRIKYLFFCP